MISFINGIVDDIEEDALILEAQGIGYRIYMPQRILAMVPRTGTELKVYTYLNVKEDAMQLFGFLSKDDLFVFKKVITVSGIGPKGGLSILSALSADDLRFAVMAKDVKAISAAQGIGKKTAEKLIIELSDKLDLETAVSHVTEQNTGNVPAGGVAADVKQDVIAALTALGYQPTEAMKAVRQLEIKEDSKVEDVLKQALKVLSF